MTRSALIGAATIALALISGCGSSPSEGSPVPAGDDVGTGDTTSAPGRPRELRLDGRDPCALVPTSDWAKFYIEKPGKSKRNATFKSAECFYSNSVGAFDITLVVTEGIDAWRGGERIAQPKDVASIAGFPTISLLRPSDRSGCDIAVDVADGQYLLATVVVDTDKVSALPERCEYAHQLAESAMNTLVGS